MHSCYPSISRLLTILVLPVAFLMMPPEARAQQAFSAIDQDTLWTGDLITYRVRLTGVEAFDDVIYPDSADFAPDFQIRGVRAESDQYGDTLTYSLRFFGVDRQSVPQLHAGLVRGLDTLLLAIPEVPFIYKSRVDDPDADLRPLKPIFPFFRSWWPFLLLGLLLAAVTAWLLNRYRKKLIPDVKPASRPAVRLEPFRNPLDDLRRELDRIQYAYNEPEKQAKQFYTELGDAFRSYIERTYKHPALESTTYELMRFLESDKMDEQMSELLHSILQEADLVKFAKYAPTESECKNVMNDAFKLYEHILNSDRYRIAVLRRKHEEEQKAKLTEETNYDLG